MSIEDEVENWQQAYGERADVYEEFSRSAEKGVVLKRLLERAQFAGKTVLEIGCGTGRQTKQLAPLSGRYVALDLSSSMLDLARKTCRGCPNITFLQAAAESLPLPEACVDVVFSGWTLPPEPWETALGEVDRVLSDSGDAWVLANHPEKGKFMEMRGEKEVEGELEVYRFMLDHGYEHVDTIETSFVFPSLDEAKRILGFIFGRKALRYLERNPEPRLEHVAILYHKRKWRE